MIRVCLEIGKNWVVAAAVDWPGWSRRGKGEEGALEVLEEYRERYAAIVGAGFPAKQKLEVIGTVPGTMLTDFWAPAVAGPWDREPPVTAKEAAQLVDVMRSCWSYFERVSGAAPDFLTLGPRGGGRQRDKMIGHVMEAERAYARKFGVRVPPRTPWSDQQQAIAAAMSAGGPSAADDPKAWPLRYFARRAGYHLTDHAWEIEDRS